MEEYYYFSYDIDNGMFLGFLIPQIHKEEIEKECTLKINKELWSKLQQIDCIANLDSVLAYVPETTLTLDDFDTYFTEMDFSTPLLHEPSISDTLMKEIANEKIKKMQTIQLERNLMKTVGELKLELIKIKKDTDSYEKKRNKKEKTLI